MQSRKAGAFAPSDAALGRHCAWGQFQKLGFTRPRYGKAAQIALEATERGLGAEIRE
jgi:hypothetical protein